MWLTKAAKAQLREIVREELRSELERIVNPTFIATVTAGAEHFERILDTVIECDEKHEELRKSVQILERAVADLQTKRRRPPRDPGAF